MDRHLRLVGRELTVKVRARCRVCASSRREEVDAALAAGRMPSQVWSSLALGSDLAVLEVERHQAGGHVPVVHASGSPAVLARAAARAVAAPRGADGGVDGEVDPLALARQMATAVAGRLAAGELKPSAQAGLAAANLIARIEADRTPLGSITEEDAARVMQAYSDAAREVMTREQLQEYGAILTASPVINEFTERHRRNGQRDSK